VNIIGVKKQKMVVGLIVFIVETKQTEHGERKIQTRLKMAVLSETGLTEKRTQ
jgi:hypothetical protein